MLVRDIFFQCHATCEKGKLKCFICFLELRVFGVVLDMGIEHHPGRLSAQLFKPPQISLCCCLFSCCCGVSTGILSPLLLLSVSSRSFLLLLSCLLGSCLLNCCLFATAVSWLDCCLLAVVVCQLMSSFSLLLLSVCSCFSVC